MNQDKRNKRFISICTLVSTYLATLLLGTLVGIWVTDVTTNDQLGALSAFIVGFTASPLLVGMMSTDI